MKGERKTRYKANKATKVGEEIVCPICGTKFVKKQYSQAFCSTECKDKFWNDKKKGKRNAYFHKYNMEHPERLAILGIETDGNGKLGHRDEDGNFWTFEEEQEYWDMCDDPFEGR